MSLDVRFWSHRHRTNGLRKLNIELPLFARSSLTATLVRALAIQFQVYVLAPAQAGAHSPLRSSWGESLAFDPWGRPLGRLQSIDDFEASGGDRKGAMPSEFLLVDLDMKEVDSTREQIPLSIQKRADVYGVVGEKA